MSQPLKKAIISVQKQPDTKRNVIDIYSISFLFVEFSSNVGGIYKAVSEQSVYVPQKKQEKQPDLVLSSVYQTSSSIYGAMFNRRVPLEPLEVAGYIRGQILALLIASGMPSVEQTKFIGLEIFKDLSLLTSHRYLLNGDFSEDAIDIRSSFETLMEAKHDVDKNKQALLKEIMDKGIIPDFKNNPKDPNEPLYECYQCLKIYNGMLKYGRMPLK